MKVDLHRTEALVWGVKNVSFIALRSCCNFVDGWMPMCGRPTAEY